MISAESEESFALRSSAAARGVGNTKLPAWKLSIAQEREKRKERRGEGDIRQII